MKKIVFAAILNLFFCFNSFSQFGLSGQILNRTEYKHGYGTLLDTGISPAITIGQRSRLNASYTSDKVKFGIAIQDIRTFGSTPQLKLSDGFLSTHKAWGEIYFTPKFSFKIGRQELDYDDARFLGNVDWALQARSHDIALFKYKDSARKLSIHGGFAYNQMGDFTSYSYYAQSNQYKTAQFLWVNKVEKDFTIGFLLWNDGLQSDSSITHRDKINYTLTTGLPIIEYRNGELTYRGFFYYQYGWDIRDKNVSAYNGSAEINYTKILDTVEKRSISITGGCEILSGTSQTDLANTMNNSYNPLYGTNHRHNGYMDYFYVGGRHLNSVGLIDGHLNVKYSFNSVLFFGMNAHLFNSAADVRDINLPGVQNASSYLGTEIDLTGGYQFAEAVSFQGGYSQMFGSSTLQMLRGGNTSATQNWAYLAIIFRPGLKNKFTGLKF